LLEPGAFQISEFNENDIWVSLIRLMNKYILTATATATSEIR